MTARKIFKEMYPGTYNFKDETVGTSGTDIGFVDSATLYDGAAEIVASWQGHRKVLRILDDETGGEDPQISHGETQATSGTREFWIGTNDVTEAWHIYYWDTDAGDYIIRFRITASELQYRDNADVFQTIQAVANDTLYHLRVVWRADNTFDCYVDGTKQVDNQATNNNQVGGISSFRITCSGDSTAYLYLDAYGDPDNDATYAIGDNIDWRHLKESTDSFEGDDVGTQGTSITWVDFVDTAASVEIVPEFNAHKKVLRQDYTSAAGGFDYCYHTFASQNKDAWYSFWIKVTDVTGDNQIQFMEGIAPITPFRISASQFQKYTAAAWSQIAGSPTPVNNTWYYIYFKVVDAATDTVSCWINNVFYETYNTQTNQTSGINRMYIYSYANGDYVYIDAPMSSLDSDLKGENRTYEYLAYSYDDISTYLTVCRVHDIAYQASTAFIQGTSSITLDANHFIQLYDANGDLRFEGKYTKEDQASLVSGFPLLSLNAQALGTEISYTASAAQDVNATLLGNFTNVSHINGRLLYYTEDDPAGNLTPNYKNKPNWRLIKDLAIHGGKYGIIRPNGLICLDDDRNPESGAATISATTGEIMNNPKIELIDHQINYVLVRGAFDPTRGYPYYGVSEDTTAQGVDGIIPYYKRFRELESDTDCQNRAIAIRTGTGFTPSIVKNVELKSVYAIPGEIINFAYSHKSFSATNCYVEEVTHNLITGISIYRLNTGLFDRVSMREPGYTLADETSDDINEIIYTTDRIPMHIPLMPGTGAWTGSGIELDLTEYCYAYLYIDDYMDTDRDILITFTTVNGANGALTIDGTLTVDAFDMDGSTSSTSIEAALNFDFTFTASSGHDVETYTIAAADLTINKLYRFIWVNAEPANKLIYMTSALVRYYQKRE